MLTNGQLHISTGGVWAIIGHAQGSHHARKKYSGWAMFWVQLVHMTTSVILGTTAKKCGY